MFYLISWLLGLGSLVPILGHLNLLVEETRVHREHHRLCTVVSRMSLHLLE
jgi:hypothetical protein